MTLSSMKPSSSSLNILSPMLLSTLTDESR